MAPEPKKPIEEMLEASAKARREAFGRDPTMPNPMRARLHDEIERLQYAEPAESRSWLKMFWPRLAVAAAMATLLVIGPMMWWRGSNRNAMQVAGPGSAQPSELPEAEAPVDEVFAKGPAIVAAATPNVDIADNDRATLQPEHSPAVAGLGWAKTSELFADAPVAAAPPAVTKGLITKEATQAEAGSARAAPAAAAAALAKSRADSNRQAVTADEQKDQSIRGLNAPSAADAVSSTPGVTQRFAQQNVAQNFQNTVQRRQVANILTLFEVQQMGNEIRLVDSDGSTYTGQLEPETQKERAAQRSYRAEDSKSAPMVTHFRATGFNVSLRKSLVFEGNYSQTPAQTKPNESAKTKAKVEQTARIVGTARVSGEPPVAVDARPVPVEKIER